MSKIAKRITVSILVILLLITGTYTAIHFFYNYKSTDWFMENVKADNYTIIGEEIGTPFWDSNSKALITIKDNNKKRFIISFSVEIENNGERLSDRNYHIEDNNEYVKVSFYNNSNDSIESYRFYYSDFNF